jgi:hypothetical protein
MQEVTTVHGHISSYDKSIIISETGKIYKTFTFFPDKNDEVFALLKHNKESEYYQVIRAIRVIDGKFYF